MARLGIDIGGTFTDFALEAKGRRHFLKVLTTPEAPEDAAFEGLARILAIAGLAPGDLETVIHGTTLAINALIERRGACIAFVTTEGFRDTIEMGNESRYDHYDLDIEKPAPLVARDLRFTVRERIGASGEVLLKLDEGGLLALLPKLDAARVEAVAIGFLHSYRNPAHETRAAQILRQHRPQWQVCTSAEVAPEIREYERFATACVNAYVQPVMAGYLERLERGLRARGVGAPLLLMLSNGGLCEPAIARRFPVRLLESGPAGGTILAADIARRFGIDRALMVDIGGTTAKLCLIDDGAPQTARSIEVARLARFKAGSGIPLRFPVIEMAEIGAGGGSIGHLDRLGRLQVGPESAGALPGPACYGRGGSAPTVTDAHLALGRLDADRFAGGRMHLDTDAADKAIAALALALSLPPEVAAWGMCEVVDENMANTIREHAVDVGKGVAGRTLIAIGGMAPLHAARLASKLGIDRIVIPAGAGVGSALGFLRAPIAFETTRSDLLSLSRFDAERVNAFIAALSREMHAVVGRAGGSASADTREQRFAWMRYRGQGHEIRVTLPVRDFGSADATVLARAFEDAYRALYGRIIASAEIEVLGWSVRVERPQSGDQDAVPAPTAEVAADSAERKFYDQGLRQYATGEVHGVAALRAGRAVPGPALLFEDETTVVVPAGFSATVRASGEVVLERIGTGAQARAMPGEIRAQVIWSRLIAVVEEQARTLMRTAFSPTVREAGDLAAGLFDSQGRLVAQAITGTPGHVNSMAACARHFLAKYPAQAMRAGDHFVTNDPWFTSGHLHDVTVFSPVFRGDRAIGFFACTCHQVDIGGLGQGPDGRSVYEEGLYIPLMRLARKGSVNEDLLDIVRANVRQPEAVIGDLLSYITANEVSSRVLIRMLDEFGEPDMEAIGDAVRARSRAGMREAIAQLPRGTFRNRMRLDGYDQPVEIRCALTIEQDGIRIGFDGSSPASSYGINLVLNYTRAYAAFGVRTVVAPEIPNNEGSLSVIEIDAPEGSILNVKHPAPVCARHIIGQFLPDVVLGCLAQARPGRIPAEGAATNWGLQLRGGPAISAAAGRSDLATAPFEILFFNSGGTGARAARDGLSATAFPSGIRSIPVEICETDAPIVIWTKELLPDSGGAGRQRGGLGQRVEVGTINGAPFQVFGIFDRVRHPARGRDGGADGRPGWVGLRSGVALRSMGLQSVPAGEVLRIDVPGGAGLGEPGSRSREAIEADIRLGYVTRTAADAPADRKRRRDVAHRKRLA